VAKFMPFACGFAILFVDQWTKWLIQAASLNRNPDWVGIVRFQFVPHRSRSYEAAGSRVMLALTWFLALVCTVILCRTAVWFQGIGSLVGLGLAFGGAASNSFDILLRRYVIGFIDLGWWPVFNLADVAIVSGLAAAFQS